MSTTKKTSKKKTSRKKRTAKTAAKTPATKPATTGGSAKALRAKKPKAEKAKRVSLLDAAATVLADAKTPMQARAIVDAVVEQGLWKPGAGRTPHATLYAAMTREIAAKGKDARFRKVDRGQFEAVKGGKA
jgi:hypothetical protein